MLLKIDDYKRLIKAENEPETQGDVLIYMLDINQDRQKTIDAVCSSVKGIPFSVNAAALRSHGSLPTGAITCAMGSL